MRDVAGEDKNGEVVADMFRLQLGDKPCTMTAEYGQLDVEDLREVIISPIAIVQEGRRVTRAAHDNA
jgi:hypothetical protein